MTPAQKDGKWFVEHGGQEVAGPFNDNSSAWRWIDRQEGQPISRAEKQGEWMFGKSAGAGL